MDRNYFSRLIFTPVRLLFPTNPLSDIEKLIFLTTLVGGFLLFTTNYVFDTDGYLFVSYADALIHGAKGLDSGVARYDIAYPLLLLLSGYPLHHSLIGIAIINMIMAILMPVLIYFTIRPVFPKGAYYVALASILSLVPFYYMKWIRPDHAYVFFTVLSVCFLSLFIDSKRAVYLYAMTLAIIAASLSRSAGNIFFPFFLFMAFWFVRGSLTKYVISAMLGLCIFSLYGYHRNQFFSQFGESASFNGGQTFQNLYVNSKEYGIHLSPDLGPNFKKITDNFYQAVLPHPSLASFITAKKNFPNEAFLKEHVYPYSPEEFVKHIYEVPSRDYYILLYEATPSDATFLKASWEVIRKYPWYPIAFATRNMWHLLYDPGFSHSRYNVNPYGRTGIHGAFPFDSKLDDYVIISPLHLHALQEILFDNFSHKPPIVEKMIRHLKNIYCDHYLQITKIGFFLMACTWIAVLIDLANRIYPSDKLGNIVYLLPRKMMPLVVAISLYLFLSMLIISVFVDPLLRFHNHLLPFKIMLAGLGVGVILHVLSQLAHPFFYGILLDQEDIHWEEEAVVFKEHRGRLALLVLMIVTLLVAWGMYIV